MINGGEQNRGGRLVPSKNLLMLERGADELLLLNSIHNRPLYIPRGREQVKNYLETACLMESEDEVRRAFPEDGALLDMLLEHRIVLYEQQQQAGADLADRSHLGKARDDREAMSLYLLLAQSCNLGCVYCLNGRDTYHKDAGLKMDERVAFRSVERCLESLNENGRLEIVFFGGEPLLNWPLAKKIILHTQQLSKDRFPSRSVQYHLTSNLTIMPKDLIDWAKQYNMTFLCDIDGPPAVHDACRPYKNGKPSHHRTAANIEKLRKAGLPVALRSTITSVNQDLMLEIANHHRDLGGTGCALVPVNPINSDEDILSGEMLPQAEKLVQGLTAIHQSGLWQSDDLFPFNVYASHLRCGGRNVLGCGAPYGNTPVVDVGGDVYPCIYLVGIKRFYLGNIMANDYPDNRVLDWMMDYLHVDNMDECRNCAWRYICGGGCPVGKLTILGNPDADDKIKRYCNAIRCVYSRKTIELMLWEFAQKAAEQVFSELPKADGAAIEHTINC